MWEIYDIKIVFLVYLLPLCIISKEDCNHENGNPSKYFEKQINWRNDTDILWKWLEKQVKRKPKTSAKSYYSRCKTNIPGVTQVKHRLANKHG